MDCSPPGSTVYEIFQARILEWVAISFSRGSSQPRVRTRVSYTAANSLLTELQGKPNFIHRLIIKSISFDVPNVIVSLLSQFPFSILEGILTSIIVKQKYKEHKIVSVQFSSVAQSCPTLCDPMNRSTPGLPVHHQLLEFTQTHVHRISDAIQPSHPLLSSSPPAPNPSQHQSLFQ